VNIRLAAVAVAIGVLAGCGSKTSTVTGGSSTGSLVHGSPLASVPGADKAAMKAVVDQCTPASGGGAAQLKWATSMVNDTKAHPNGSRTRLWACVGIPQASRQAAEGDLLTKIEHVTWTSKDSRAQFWDVTMPAWVMQWRTA
jgi:hypothetical protein